MAEQDINRKILIDITQKSDKLLSEVQVLNSALDKLNVTQKSLKDAGQQNTRMYNENASQIRQLKQEIRDVNKEIDNTSKAFNAENNSIAQNRALLISLTSEYVKLEQSQGKSSKATQDMAKQINALSDKLKAQESAIGQNQRNVGNYQSALSSIGNNLASKYIPGFSQFGSVLSSAAQNFGKLGKSATTAEAGMAEAGAAAPAVGEGMEGAAVGVGGLIAAFLAVVAVIAVVIEHFAALTPQANALAQRFAYLKGAIRGFLDDIGTGAGFGQLADDMKKTAQEAADLKLKMQDLERQAEANSVANAKFDEQIQVLQLHLRGDLRRQNLEEEQKDFHTIQAISLAKYKVNKKYADDSYDVAVRTAINSRRFTQQEIDDLKRLGVQYAIVLDKKKGLVNGQDDIKAIAAAQVLQTNAERDKLVVDERAENRDAAFQAKREQRAEKERQQLLELQQAYNEQVSMRTESYQRMLELQQDAFGKELSQTAEHYRQLLFKEQEFILKQEKIRDDKKSSPKVKAAAGRNIGAARSNIAQIESEQYIATEKLLVDHNRAVLDETRKAALDLKALQIANMSDIHEREMASANNSYEEKRAELDKEEALLQQQRRNINKQLADDDAKAKNDKTRYTADQIQALKTDLNTTDQLLANNADKRIATEKATTKQLEKIDRDFYNSQQLQWDQIYILQAQNKKGITGGINNPFNKDLQNAKENELRDQEAKELSAEGLTAVQKTLIHEQYLEKIKELDDQYRDQRIEAEIQGAQLIADTGFSIISNAIKHTADQRQADLERAKTTELNNQALTKTQVAIINEKYRKQEGAAKVKEFRDTQKIDIAKAVMAGARAVVEDLTQPWKIPFDIATTAAEIAVIATQKPPAYAKGTGPVHAGNGMVRGAGSWTSDSIPARLSNGESVINARSTSMFGALLSAINVAGGGVPFATPNFSGHFATGGVASTTYVPTITNNFTPALPTITHLSDQSIGDIVNGMGSVQIVTDVKDINNQQNIRARVIDRTVL